MPISLSCACGRALKVKDELAGKKIRCPECKDILTVPVKDHVDVLEVVADDEDEETTTRRPRRAAIQSELPEVKPARRAIEDDKPPRRKRPKPPRDIRRRAPLVAFEEGWFGSINAGIAGGILMMLIAVVWLIAGLAFGRLFFYPIGLFVIGFIAMVKGGLD